jgi:DNA-binding NarL/FixJ family response regulator
MTSVLVVDDEALVRRGLEMILSSSGDIDVVGTCDALEALDLTLARRPDVVLLDIRMPRRDGLQVLAQLMAVDAPPVVAMLTTFDTEEHLAAALAGGASGFLLKDTDPVSLIRSVHVLASGGLVLAPGVDRRRLVARATTGGAPAPELSGRQLQVVRELAAGRTNAQIAQSLGVSTGTIKDDISSVLESFGVTSRVEAALVAAQHGLLGD